MFPGMGGRGMNPRKMNQMMRQLGINVDEVPDVEEVIVRTKDKEYVLSPAEVSIMTAQGTKTWQVVPTGEVQERAREGAAPAASFTDDDVKLVAEQAGVSPDEARAALEEVDGEPAEAIIRLMEGGNS